MWTSLYTFAHIIWRIFEYLVLLKSCERQEQLKTMQAWVSMFSISFFFYYCTETIPKAQVWSKSKLEDCVDSTTVAFVSKSDKSKSAYENVCGMHGFETEDQGDMGMLT